VIAVGDLTRQENFDLDLRDLAPATPSVITFLLLRRILEPYSSFRKCLRLASASG
jgi:hypothetical protein